jgi:hypothetical protein
VAHWWGLARSTITRWRIRLGVNRYNAGSKRLHLINSEKAPRPFRGVPLSAEAVERRRRTALELGLRPTNGYGGSRAWTDNELRMLGTMPDEVLAKKLARSTRAVRLKRTRLGTVKQVKCRWTAKEDTLLGLPPVEVTRLTGRTGRAIYARRKLLMLYRRKGSKTKSNRPEPRGNRHYETPRPYRFGLLSEVQEGRTVHRKRLTARRLFGGLGRLEAEFRNRRIKGDP